MSLETPRNLDRARRAAGDVRIARLASTFCATLCIALLVTGVTVGDPEMTGIAGSGIIFSVIGLIALRPRKPRK